MKSVKDIRELKIALVHDWLIVGGAERVVLAMHEMFPYAPIYTSYATDAWRAGLDNMVVTGYLQNKPFPKLRKYIPYLRAHWFSHLKFDDYGLVISSSGAEAKGIRVPADKVHINYCHAPTHYYWDRYDEYMAHPGFGILDPIARIGLRVLVGPMRKWDYRAAQRPTHMIANSTHTAAMIKKYYGRESVVIYPPVDVKRFTPTGKTVRKGFLIAGRQTPYKRVDLAVAACTKLGVPLTVIGTGPDQGRLRAMAGPTITFLTNVTDKDMPAYFQAAAAFIFPGLDDFGITPVEAMAAGTPIIAYKAGGALDYVIEGQTGLFFADQTVESLVNVINTFSSHWFDEKILLGQAAKFSPDIFVKNLYGLIGNIIVK
jgi:glycosyltransferase involved in cell wall biosynthesis